MKYLTPFILLACFFMLLAHALRFDHNGLVLAAAGIIPLVFLRVRWCGKVVSILLLSASYFWLNLGTVLIQSRVSEDLPWFRLAMIIGMVFGLNLAGSVLCYSRYGREWFYKNKGNWPEAASFFSVIVLGLICRGKVSFPIFLADRFFPGAGYLEIVVLGYYAAWLTSILSVRSKMRKIRPAIWALFSAVFFSQFFLGLAGFEKLLMTGKIHLPVPAMIVGGPLYRGGGYFMPILFTVSVLIVGPAWCSWLCYIGAWDDRLSRFAVRKFIPLPKKLIWFRFVLLVLVVFFALFMRSMGATLFEATAAGFLFGLAGVMVMLIFSSQRGVMVHCTAFCPMGIVSNLLGKLSLWRIKINEKCTTCGVCSRVCRYSALSAADIQKGKPALSCTMCGDCVSSCSHGAIGYKFPFISQKKSRLLFIVIVVSLHSIFLGVARI